MTLSLKELSSYSGDKSFTWLQLGVIEQALETAMETGFTPWIHGDTLEIVQAMKAEIQKTHLESLAAHHKAEAQRLNLIRAEAKVAISQLRLAQARSNLDQIIAEQAA